MDAQSPETNPSPWMPFESRRRARDEKREAVLRTAVRLFLEQGYHRVTLNDVAERLNITKPALYNYFRSKDEILFECWALGQEIVDEFIAAIDKGGGNALAKLRKLIQAYAEQMTTDSGASLVRFDARDLTAENQKIVRAAKKRIDRTFRKYLADGVADGSIKPCDPKLTAFAIAGSLNWIGHWYQRDGAWSAEAVASRFAAQLTEGLAKAPASKRGPATPKKSRPAKGGRK
ncbi:TetR/AcrR family transcriptional regulator [Bradyrhizobium sp. JYMT SZCCT0428]|uniref:TetR/AcrR family transcriptional regulator n=1 Tax=Bradyrhizobium sp. JYMT SZCCT0428 TaxID=2807673 RepID=UPI002012A182|nr:TetR/AcrR family transcriptional regulator [Bradyrhizobium sp. JYMT SZCCT0428]